WILYKRGEYPWALGVLQESAEKMPSEPEVQVHLGMAYYMMGEEEAARTTLRRALPLRADFPNKEQAARLLSFLDMDTKGSDPTVLAALEKRVAEEPGDPVAVVRLASVYERDGAVEKARGVCEKALSANAKAVPVIVKLALIFAERLHDPKRALE